MTLSKVVVDSSVVIKWFAPEANFAKARAILTEYQAGRLTLLAPDLLYAEIGNVVWKKVRFHGLDIDDGQEIIENLYRLDITVTRSVDLLRDAYRLATCYQRTVYDMTYVALSVREQCRLITADEKLACVLGDSFENVVQLSDWV